ncbi:hypothetical protein H7H52_12200 [Mycolicibacter hiberniae]|uniref:Uncharacterized protein n=2 Tax=Mycolicibacter hiberniae TaxID=29314 RepID=A0A7I7WZM1_9MYCO|nr:hypothetical protein [Mycolicibacter hiberniae]MCV7086485.1 hypothetical protein [Mycolicibacter hiberniae]ORV70003.1 hypothetical protein AWC09_11410 [Mycolicibacter hiberniae]BBZ22057.1 hypothetical protein MHIB_04750 [Mycolicibacter hiberniae]
MITRRIGVLAALALMSLPGAVVVFTPAGTTTAQGCVGVGRRVYVSGCADPVPPPAYYAPLPEDVPPPPPPPPPTVCTGYNGRWVHTANCH